MARSPKKLQTGSKKIPVMIASFRVMVSGIPKFRLGTAASRKGGMK